VLNSFQVLEQSGEPLNESFRENHICAVLRSNLLNREVREGINIHRLSRQAKHFPIATQIQFHRDPLNQYTILELITTDYAGLLSRIGKAFIQEGINLHSAKITTIGSRAEDMFYITDQQLQPITDSAKQEQLKATILQV
jgi:[protein-PII] uridylyltransferase